MRRIRFLASFTHGWGEGKDHQRIKGLLGEERDVPEDVATELRRVGLAEAVVAADQPAETATPGELPRSMTLMPGQRRPGDLASRLR